MRDSWAGSRSNGRDGNLRGPTSLQCQMPRSRPGNNNNGILGNMFRRWWAPLRFPMNFKDVMRIEFQGFFTQQLKMWTQNYSNCTSKSTSKSRWYYIKTYITLYCIKSHYMRCSLCYVMYCYVMLCYFMLCCIYIMLC